MNPESFQTESYKDATTDPDNTKTKKDKSYAKHLNMQLQNIKNTYSVKCTSKLLCAEGYFVTLLLVLQEIENGFITPDLGEGVMYGIVMQHAFNASTGGCKNPQQRSFIFII